MRMIAATRCRLPEGPGAIGATNDLENDMGNDPYAALGVSKTASDEDIKKAYRKIVKTSHPDINPDDPEAEARFKAATAAFDLLKDPEQRARFDRGEIDAMGNETPQYHQQQYYRQYAGAEDNPYGGGQHFEDFEDLSDFFSDYLRGRGSSGFGFGSGHAAGGGEGFRARGADRQYRLEVPFLDAALGGTTRITLPEGGTLEVQIPRGIREGQTIRLRGKGAPGFGGGPTGDALITVHIGEHPVFRREGNNIRVVLPISIDEAILGGKVPVPTITGPVKLTIPKGASSGQVLRMKDRGVKPKKGKTGDQLVELKIVSPPEVDDELAKCMREWRKSHAYDPRKGMV